MTDQNDVVEVMARAIIAYDEGEYALEDANEDCQQRLLAVHRDMASGMIDALRAAGYRIVPYEPTEAMVRAGAAQQYSHRIATTRAAYQAILDASPTQQTQKKE